MQPDLEPVIRVFRAARSALFVTGAGVSADSGLPTYRGIGGLYANGLTEDGIPYEEALSGATLRARPEVCWRTIGQVEAACRGATHNRAHSVIAALEQRMDRVVVLTQNVDGLHTDAGSTDVVEVHGTLRRLRCTRCAWCAAQPQYESLVIPPSCPDCGSLARPDVVLFGEMLPESAQQRLAQLQPDGFDVVCVVGTTAVFPYIAWPIEQARRCGVPTVEINPGRSEVSHLVDHRVQLGAAEALHGLWQGISEAGESVL